ncbi:MAG: co-chaperone GroES [Alphaproteobacteria bacterium]|nr:co-chaperone GroES [Alphaproteobacteria bacterium]MBN2779749.1 co-chaperone GroES [Alphaproteobacteria bacterium]
MTNFTPLHNNVLVKRIEEESKTAGGIYIPDTAKEKPSQGEVIAVGAGDVKDGSVIPMTVKTGDRILFGKWSGTEVKLDGQDYIIMKETDILGIMK